MVNQNTQETRDRIFSLIDERFGSDAAFERAANLAPKTVNNWRRGRSTSYMKLLPELARLFEVPVRRLVGEGEDEPTLSRDEQELLALYRATDTLSESERMALNETLKNTIDLYLSSRRRQWNDGRYK